MKKLNFSLIIIFLVIFLNACGPTPEEQAAQTATSLTATAFSWTRTFTPTLTYTHTNTTTATDTLTPTITVTPTITFTPTYDYPKVRVNVANLSCRYGPAKAFLHYADLHQGDTGVVWGRFPYSDWIFVRMDNLPGPCWLHPFYADIEGDINKMIYETIRLPMTNALYAAPTNVRAERNGNEVTVSWDEVWMTLDDDRGYFLDVWVCQGGYPVWMPVALPDQYHTNYTFIDEPGCAWQSGGKLYTVEKHGYPNPVDIPWPKAGEQK